MSKKYKTNNQKHKEQLEKLAVDLDLDYKFVSWADGSDFVVYPDNYTNEDVYFVAYRYNDNSDDYESLFEDMNGNYQCTPLSNEDFFKFVKNYRLD